MGIRVGRDGKKTGEITLEAFQAAIARGQIRPDDLIWQDGWTDWKPYAEVTAQFAPPPQASPPPQAPKPVATIKTARGDAETGDWTPETLQAAVDRGDVKPDDLVWKEGWAEWKALSVAAEDLGVRFPASKPPALPRASEIAPDIRTARDNKETGRWTKGTLQAAVNSGAVKPDDLVRKKGWTEWKKLSNAAGEIGIQILADHKPSSQKENSQSEKKESPIEAFLGLAFLGLIGWIGWKVIVFLIGFFGNSNDPVAIAGNILRQQVRSPSSFSLLGGHVVWTGKNEDGNPAYIVQVQYESQNAFGAMLKGCSYVAYAKNGEKLQWYNNFSSTPDCDKQYISILMMGNQFKD